MTATDEQLVVIEQARVAVQVGVCTELHDGVGLEPGNDRLFVEEVVPELAGTIERYGGCHDSLEGGTVEIDTKKIKTASAPQIVSLVSVVRMLHDHFAKQTGYARAYNEDG